MNELDSKALELQVLYGDSHGLKRGQVEREKNRLLEEIYDVLKKSIRVMIVRKHIPDLQEEAVQHCKMAIIKAVATWDGSISTFSTFVHWKIRAELAELAHCLMPERRKIEVKYPVSYVPLNAPVQCPDGASNACLIDFMEDEGAAEAAEEAAEWHMAMHNIERVWSHYIAADMVKFCRKTRDLGKIADRRMRLMRMRYIYVQSMIYQETYATIAATLGITRERVRQIDAKVAEIFARKLPVRDGKSDQIVWPTERPPVDIHPCWNAMLAEYAEHVKSKAPESSIDPLIEVQIQKLEDVYKRPLRENERHRIQRDVQARASLRIDALRNPDPRLLSLDQPMPKFVAGYDFVSDAIQLEKKIEQATKAAQLTNDDGKTVRHEAAVEHGADEVLEENTAVPAAIESAADPICADEQITEYSKAQSDHDGHSQVRREPQSMRVITNPNEIQPAPVQRTLFDHVLTDNRHTELDRLAKAISPHRRRPQVQQAA